MEQEPRVESYMSRELVAFTPEMDVLRAMRTLVEREVAGAPVVDESGNLVGVLSERDCLRVAYPSLYYQQPAGRVADYMSREVQTLPADMLLSEAAEAFFRGPYRRFPVVSGPRLVGSISRRDVLRAMLERY